MRLAIGALWHQTNTFSPVPTTAGDFNVCGSDADAPTTRGPAILREIVADLAAAAREFPATLVPSLVTGAVSSGTVPSDTFELLIDKLSETLARVDGPLDGVILCLSGGLVVADDDDGDAAVVERARRALGSGVKVGVVVGPYANLTQRLVDAADIVIGLGHGGEDARKRLARMLATFAARKLPPSRLVKLPLLVPPAVVDSPAFAELLDHARAARAAPGVIEAFVTSGFPFADVSHAGASILAYADNQDQATRVADAVADATWTARAGLTADTVNVEIAVHSAMAAATESALLLDSGDDPSTGGPGDGTALLWALLDLGADRAFLGVLHDPSAVAQAMAAGPRCRVRLSLGAHHDRRHGYPVEIDATVVRLVDGPTVQHDRAGHGRDDRPGRMALIRASGRHGGEVEILIGERRLESVEPSLLARLGVDLSDYRLVAIKGNASDIRALGQMGSPAFQVATPGVTVPIFEFYDFRKLPRPVFPLDPI